jgi:hypothetical protein
MNVSVVSLEKILPSFRNVANLRPRHVLQFIFLNKILNALLYLEEYMDLLCSINFSWTLVQQVQKLLSEYCLLSTSGQQLECFYLFPENPGVLYVPGQVLESYLFLDQSRSIICSKTNLGVLSVPGPALQSLLFVPESALKYCLILNQPRSTFCSWTSPAV